MSEENVIQFPAKDGPLPTRQEMLAGYMSNADKALGIIFEATARIAALTGQDGAARPEIGRAANQVQTNIEVASMWLTKVGVITELYIKEEDDANVPNI